MDWYHGLTSIRQNVIHKRKFNRNIQREFMGHQGCVLVLLSVYCLVCFFWGWKRKKENGIWCLMIVEPKHSLQKLRINFFSTHHWFTLSILVIVELLIELNWEVNIIKFVFVCFFSFQWQPFPWYFYKKIYIFWPQRCFNDD